MSRRKKVMKLIKKAIEQEHLYQEAEIIYMKKQLAILKAEHEEHKRLKKNKGFG